MEYRAETAMACPCCARALGARSGYAVPCASFTSTVCLIHPHCPLPCSSPTLIVCASPTPSASHALPCSTPHNKAVSIDKGKRYIYCDTYIYCISSSDGFTFREHHVDLVWTTKVTCETTRSLVCSLPRQECALGSLSARTLPCEVCLCPLHSLTSSRPDMLKVK